MHGHLSNTTWNLHIYCTVHIYFLYMNLFLFSQIHFESQMTRCTLPKYGYLDTNLTTSAHFSGNLAWETIHVLCSNVLIPINWSGVFIKFLKEPWGNAVEVWVTSYSLHYLIWKYPKRTSANEEILRSVLLSKSSGLCEEIFMPAVEICCRS